VRSLSELAEKAATEMVLDIEEPLRSAGDNDQGEVMTIEKNSILSKIRFAWRPADKQILERIHAAAEALFLELYADAITTIDEFYASLRVPQVTDSGVTIIGSNGRPVWVIDEATGRPMEDISQLTGQDIDEAILRLQRVLLEVVPQVNELMLEALAAYHIAKDSYDDAWFGMVEGTQGDRTAHSNRQSRVDKWHSYFRHYVFSQSKVFLDEINALLRRLDNIAYRQQRSQ
jgi:hypothetical protein